MYEKFEKPTEVLVHEHEVIEKGLSILEKLIIKYQQEDSLDVKRLEQIVDFFKNFADKCHHAKEEKLLFPSLTTKGMPVQGGPIGVLLQEHDIGRRYISGILEGIKKYSSRVADAKEEISNNCLGYIELLRQHIYKENNVLFPMAENLLSDSEQKELLEDFEEIEEKEIGPEVHEKYAKMIGELEKEY